MEKNTLTFDKYADRLLTAMKEEKLMNREVAEIFDVPARYMTDVNKRPEKISMPFMEKIRAWSISGKPLRDYKLPQAPDTEAAAINQQQVNDAPDAKAEIITAIYKKRSKLATADLVKEHMAAEAAEVREALHEAIAESVNTEEPTKEERAETIRYHYEQVHKVDPNKLDRRTGVLASAELQILPDGSLHIICTYK